LSRCALCLRATGSGFVIASGLPKSPFEPGWFDTRSVIPACAGKTIVATPTISVDYQCERIAGTVVRPISGCRASPALRDTPHPPGADRPFSLLCMGAGDLPLHTPIFSLISTFPRHSLW
jgi:hypothetical protein